MVQDSAASRVHHWYSQHSICQINGVPEFHWCLNIKEWCFSKIFTLPKFWQKLSVRRLELTFFLGNFPRSNPHLHLEGPDLHHLHHYPPSSPNLDMKLIPTSISASTKVNGICGVTFQPRKKSHQNWSSLSSFASSNFRKNRQLSSGILKKMFFCGLSRWFIKGGKQKIRSLAGQHVIFFPNLLQNPSKKSFKHTFRQKQTAEFHGIRIETRKSFFVSFHIFHAHKKNLPRSLQYLPKKTCQGPKIEGIETSFLPLKIGSFFSHHVSPWFFENPSGCCQ